MAYASKPLEPGEKTTMFWTDIHKSACDAARQSYLDMFGIDYHDDPLYSPGSERHSAWISAYDNRMRSLIANPYQN